MKYLWILAFLCSSSQAFNINNKQKLPQHITFSCPEDQLVFALGAFKAWNFVLDEYFTFERVDSGGVIQINQTDDDLGHNIFGWTFSLGTTAHILVRRVDPVPYSILMHEIGHALGLMHSTDPEAIMFPQVGLDADLTQDDIDGIRLIYGLSPKIYDFDLKVVRHNVKVSNKLDWTLYEFSDNFGKGVKSGKAVIHRMPRGTYTVIAYITVGIKIKKQFTIK